MNGDYTVFGSEILIQRNWSKFNSWVSYTINRNRYYFDSYIPNEFPNNFEIQQNVACAVSYENKGLKVGIGWKWNSGRPTTNPLIVDGKTIHYKLPNSDSVTDYIQSNLSMSYVRTISKTVQINISGSLLNIFNRSNVINKYYRVNNFSDKIEDVSVYSMKRTPNISIRATFK